MGVQCMGVVWQLCHTKQKHMKIILLTFQSDIQKYAPTKRVIANAAQFANNRYSQLKVSYSIILVKAVQLQHSTM